MEKDSIPSIYKLWINDQEMQRLWILKILIILEQNFFLIMSIHPDVLDYKCILQDLS